MIRMMKRERGNRKIRIVSFILIAMKHAFGDGRTKVILQFFNQVIIHVCMYVCRENIHATRLVPLLPRPAHLFEFLVTLLLVFAEFCALQKVHLLKICVFTLCVSLKIVHLLLLLAVLRCESTRLPKIYTYIYVRVCCGCRETRHDPVICNRANANLATERTSDTVPYDVYGEV